MLLNIKPSNSLSYLKYQLFIDMCSIKTEKEMKPLYFDDNLII